jgi:membrane protein implicated in regulation of membrane protease activity
MAGWVGWLLAAGVLGVAELLTLTLVLGMLALAALPAAAVAAFGGPLALQVVVFAVGGVATLAGVRPIARRHARGGPGLRTGAAALVGQSGTVVAPIGAVAGQVRVGGEVWTARAYAEDMAIPAGARVDVVAIEGATAVVLPRSGLDSLEGQP